MEIWKWNWPKKIFFFKIFFKHYTGIYKIILLRKNKKKKKELFTFMQNGSVEKNYTKLISARAYKKGIVKQECKSDYNQENCFQPSLLDIEQRANSTSHCLLSLLIYEKDWSLSVLGASSTPAEAIHWPHGTLVKPQPLTTGPEHTSHGSAVNACGVYSVCSLYSLRHTANLQSLLEF